jgi:cobalamin synthase
VRRRGILRTSEKGPDPLVVTEGVYTLNLGWVLDCRSKTVEVVYYLGKFLAAGIVVVLFAVVSESFQPKRFAGLFSAAPSVLLASLIVTVLLEGTASGSLIVSGAVAGGVGLVAYALVSAWAVNRFKGLAGSLLSLLPWAVVSVVAYLVLMGAK